MADYNSNYTGQEIDEAVGKALNPDSAPTAGSQALVTSGGVAGGLAKKASASDVNAMAEKIPSGASSSNKLVTQADIANFITRSVNDLVNYYLKSDTYTKQEVQALIAAINQFHYEVYESLSDVTSPASNVLYLIGPTGSGSDKYEEYVWPNATLGFVKIGDTSIDLSGYVTTQALNAALATKVNISDIVDNLTTDDATKVLSAKQGKILDGKVSQLGQEVNLIRGSVVKLVNLQEVTRIQDCYPRTNGLLYSASGYVTAVYDVSELDELLVSGKCFNGVSYQNIALLLFATSYTTVTGQTLVEIVTQPFEDAVLRGYSIPVPEHNGTLYALVCITTPPSQAAFVGQVADGYYNIPGAIDDSLVPFTESLMKQKDIPIVTQLDGYYPRVNGEIQSGAGYKCAVYDVSTVDTILLNGVCLSGTPFENIALVLFKTDYTDYSATNAGVVVQPAENAELYGYNVKVPAHSGTLYAIICTLAAGGISMFSCNLPDGLINVSKELSEIDEQLEEFDEQLEEFDEQLEDINDGLSVFSELQGTLIVGYPRTNGRMSGDAFRSKVYNVSNIDKIYVSGTITSPNVVLLAAFSTDSTFASFTHGTVTQPTDVETIVNYEVQVPVHSGPLYVCIPFATTVDYVEVGGNVFTSVKSKHLFIPQEFDTRLKNDEDRISALEASPKIIINCVGDSITQGQKGILNLRDGTVDNWNRYPYYLQQLLGTNYNIKNYGYGGNDPSSIFTAMGWEGVVINQDITLKGDKTPVGINDVNSLTDTNLNLDVSGYLSQFRTTEAETAQTKCSVFGIPCNISRSDDVLYLERQEAASYDTAIPAGTMLCFDGVLDKDGISILFTGENNMTLYTQNNGADFVEYLRNIVSKISNGKYIIIGLHVAATQLSDINSIKTANNALRKEFGNRFIDLQKELSSYAIFQQLNYVPTSDSFFTAEQLAGGVYSDEGAITLGIQPSSFWRQVKGIADYTANDSIHMSGLGYNALAILISNRLKTLGWVTE